MQLICIRQIFWNELKYLDEGARCIGYGEFGVVDKMKMMNKIVAVKQPKNLEDIIGLKTEIEY